MFHKAVLGVINYKLMKNRCRI